MPLSVAVALVQCNGELLLIRRTRGDYAHWWALPGGKIEAGEHVAAAAQREIREEAGLDTSFDRHLGVVSEHLVEDRAVRNHFLLHVCTLAAQSQKVRAGDEGELRWMDVHAAADSPKRLVPSDRAMIQHLLLEGDTGYHECVMEKDGDDYRLRTFE